MKQHDQFDNFVSEWQAGYRESGKTIYCRDSCPGCCHLAVHATYPESVAVAKVLTEPQQIRLTEYIASLKAVLPELTSLKKYLKKHRQELGPCPFLNVQGSCSIYPVRPLSCRALLSTRPAAWCTVDFSELNEWDKQAYISSLDRQTVAWPTHYVAATQDFGRELESHLLESMQRSRNWCLSGNFAVMVWIEQSTRLSQKHTATTDQVREMLSSSGVFNPLLLDFIDNSQNSSSAG